MDKLKIITPTRRLTSKDLDWRAPLGVIHCQSALSPLPSTGLPLPLYAWELHIPDFLSTKVLDMTLLTIKFMCRVSVRQKRGRGLSSSVRSGEGDWVFSRCDQYGTGWSPHFTTRPHQLQGYGSVVITCSTWSQVAACSGITWKQGVIHLTFLTPGFSIT